MNQGKKEGEWKTWYENGQLESQGHYIQDQKEGEWKDWQENGQLWSQGQYIHGKMEGEWKHWLENGVFTQGYYVQDREEGEWTFQYANGQFARGNFVHGEYEGEWKIWNANGQLDYHGRYFQGKRTGNCSGRLDNGQLSDELYCLHDQILKPSQISLLLKLQAWIKKMHPILRLKRYLPVIQEIWYTPGCKGAWNAKQSFERELKNVRS